MPLTVFPTRLSRTPLLPSLLFVTAAVLFALSANAQTYTFSSIDYPGASSTWVNGINSGGDVVGWYETTSKQGFPIYVAFCRLANGDFITLPQSGHPMQAAADGISDSGVIVGSSLGSTGFVYFDGNYRVFSLPNVAATLNGISTNDLVVGAYTEGNYVYGFQRLGTADFRVLPNLNGTPVLAFGINSAGVIVGQDESSQIPGVRWDGYILNIDGVYQVVDYPGALNTTLFGINNAGVAVGYQTKPVDTVQGFVYSQGQFTDLNYPGSTQTQLIGINAQGVLSGTYYDASGVNHGFIATPVAQ